MIAQEGQSRSVPPHALDAVFSHLNAGGRVAIQTCTRTVLITQETLLTFQRAGSWLIKEDGEGYRIRSGKSSFYVLPGQLVYC